MRLREIMTTDVISIGPDEAADTAWSRMKLAGIRHLIVKEGGRLLGVLSRSLDEYERRFGEIKVEG